MTETWHIEENPFSPDWVLLYFGPDSNAYAVEIRKSQALAILAEHQDTQRYREALEKIADDAGIHRDAEACRYDACSCAAVFARAALNPENTEAKQ